MKKILFSKQLIFILFVLTFTTTFLPAQVAINTDGSSANASAMLDVKSSNKGLLIPRITTAARTSLISTAVAGLIVYDTDLNKFYYFNGSSWEEGSTGGLWTANGNNDSYLTNLTGNVGFGISNPSYPIDIKRTTSSAFIRLTSTIGYAGMIIEKATSSKNGYLIYKSGGTDKWFVGLIRNNNFAISKSFNGTGSEFYMDSAGFVGIGTNTPARALEVFSGSNWKAARISSSSSGAFLEFKGINTTNWAFGSYDGSARLLSTTNDFANVTDEYWFTTSSLYPYLNNDRTLGASGKRWSTLYSGVGNFNSTGAGISGATVYSINSGTNGISGYFESNGNDATTVIQQNGTGKFLKAFGPDGGSEEFSIDGDGTVSMYNGSHVKTIQLDPYEGASTAGGQITMYNSAGVASIEIDGDYLNDGRITTQELQITGGSDLSEFFDLTTYEEIQKGMVVCIDEEHPGHLTISQHAYDRKVAGIVSGANDIKPGLIMSQKGSIADGEHLVALSGRVYCMVDTSNGPIKIGDMLTTSSLPGYAMKVNDFDKARGAIIGKAMTALDSGKGLVLVLVSLQ